MPKIQQDKKQLDALNTINEELITIKTLNTVLESKGNLVVAQNAGKAKYVLSKDEEEKVLAVLLQSKAKSAKKVEALAAKFKIELEQEDIELMKVEKAPKAEKPQPEKTEIDIDIKPEKSLFGKKK